MVMPLQISTHDGVERIFEMPSAYGRKNNPNAIKAAPKKEKSSQTYCVFSILTK